MDSCGDPGRASCKTWGEVDLFSGRLSGSGRDHRAGNRDEGGGVYPGDYHASL